MRDNEKEREMESVVWHIKVEEAKEKEKREYRL